MLLPRETSHPGQAPARYGNPNSVLQTVQRRPWDFGEPPRWEKTSVGVIDGDVGGFHRNIFVETTREAQKRCVLNVLFENVHGISASYPLDDLAPKKKHRSHIDRQAFIMQVVPNDFEGKCGPIDCIKHWEYQTFSEPKIGMWKADNWELAKDCSKSISFMPLEHMNQFIFLRFVDSDSEIMVGILRNFLKKHW